MERATSVPSADQLEPFFFGSLGNRLYGCYHEPGVWPAREQAVLICNPFGQEYIRAHRACQHLATTVAAAGFPAMRFDYFGTGDSSGESEEATLGQWLEDIDDACEELCDRSGASSVVLAGLRLGASLALDAASRRSDVAGLVLWEPLLDGRQYLDELRRLHAEVIARFFIAPTDFEPSSRPPELTGFALGKPMLADLERVDVRTSRPLGGRPVAVIDNSDSRALADIADAWESAATVAYLHLPSFAAWAEDVDKGLVPHAVIEAIAVWLDEVFA
jgi:alpha/beta superfamily hydrolase